MKRADLLATFYDVSADYNVNIHASIGTYFGRAAGKLVVEFIYPQVKNANFGELLFKL